MINFQFFNKRKGQTYIKNQMTKTICKRGSTNRIIRIINGQGRDACQLPYRAKTEQSKFRTPNTELSSTNPANTPSKCSN
jgi:hypothetical protein